MGWGARRGEEKGGEGRGRREGNVFEISNGNVMFGIKNKYLLHLNSFRRPETIRIDSIETPE